MAEQVDPVKERKEINSPIIVVVLAGLGLQMLVTVFGFVMEVTKDPVGSVQLDPRTQEEFREYHKRLWTIEEKQTLILQELSIVVREMRDDQRRGHIIKED